MIHTRRVIFMILPLLFVPVVYGISSTTDAQTCCWREQVPGKLLGETYCQSCQNVEFPDGSTQIMCDPKELQFRTTPPTTEETVPPGGGVAEQPEQPLFGEDVPPTGGIEQPPTATKQPAPGGGANVPNEGGTAEQPPTPQDDNQGGGLPTIKNQENVPPGGGVAEQPEDDGQEDSSEGAETAGPLT
jgi:hypothetical protein